MDTSKSADRLAFVSRQLSNLLADEQLEPALQKLSAASPAEYLQDIEYLRALLTGSAQHGPSPGLNPYATLSKLLPLVSGSKNTLFRKFAEYIQQRKIVFETYWAGVLDLLSYLATLSLVALLIAVIFGVFVVPAFHDMFSQFGATLPRLTAMVFAFGGAGIPLFAIALTLIIGLVVWFVALFHRRIRQLAPLPRWHSRIPIVGRIAEAYNLGLFLNFTRMLRESDVESGRAVSEAASLANQSKNLNYESMQHSEGDVGQLSVLSELAVAARLGYFDSEIAYQCDQHIGRMSLALVEARDRFSLILKFVLYLFIGTLVVAMYLPIFQIGSVI